jgi:hypothetical protein
MATLDWSQCPAMESVPDRVGGAWVFCGTRLPSSRSNGAGSIPVPGLPSDRPQFVEGTRGDGGEPDVRQLEPGSRMAQAY